MVMNKSMFIQTHVAHRPRRLGVAEAKMRLSELLRDATAGPTVNVRVLVCEVLDGFLRQGCGIGRGEGAPRIREVPDASAQARG